MTMDANPALETMLNMSKFHREHEKFYGKSPLEDAIRLQEASIALKTLADRWTHTEPSAGSNGNPYRGCEDLNEKGDIAHTGVLFLEAEGAPNELVQLKRGLKVRADDFAEGGEWLVRAMESAWESAKPLVQNPALADVLGERHRIITNDQHAAHLFCLSAREIRRSLEILDHLDLSSGGVRTDLAGPRSYPGYLYSASELLDLAADGVTEAGVLIHDNERRWRVWRERVERVAQRVTATPAAHA
jgi:hypothetical protein